jgi:hypothetical protein
LKLDSRITKLEKAIAPTQIRHAFLHFPEKQTEQEVIEDYCAENELDPVKFKDEGYGDYMIIQIGTLTRDS